MQKHDTLGHYPTDTMIGDIIACRSHGWSPMSWIIRKKTSSQVNHVSSCIGNGEMVEALGSVVRTKTNRLTGEWWIHLRPTGYITDANKVAMREFLVSQVGKKYDWKAIWGFGPWQSYDHVNGHPDKWFCSELVWQSYYKVGTQLSRRPNCYVFPTDILESPLVKVAGYQWPKSLMEWVTGE